MSVRVTTSNRVALTAAVYLLLGCGSAARSPELKPNVAPAISDSPTHSFEVDTDYGTLSFRGRIDRTDRGLEYEYQTHIDVTFHPNARFNRTPVADLRECRLVASVPRDSSGPWQVLHEESHPISVRLTEDGQTAHLPELTFHLSKAIAAKARRVGLAVLDGHFMWPIPVDLQ